MQGTQIYRSKHPRIASTKRRSNEGFRKTKRVKLQVMLEMNSNWLLTDQGFPVALCLVTRVLLGLNYCVRNHVIVDFPRRNLIFDSNDNDKSTEIYFVCV